MVEYCPDGVLSEVVLSWWNFVLDSLISCSQIERAGFIGRKDTLSYNTSLCPSSTIHSSGPTTPTAHFPNLDTL